MEALQNRKGVLIVDDCETDVLLLTKLLHAIDITENAVLASIKEVDDYLAGLGKFSDRVKFPIPKVIFLDIGLSDGDSRSEIPKWKQILGRETLIILMTGVIRSEVLQDAYRYGADTFLAKPVAHTDLKNLKTFYTSFFS